MFTNTVAVYLYRHIVDFRKAINGLSLIVEQEMGLDLFDQCLFVFCNRGRDKIKILYWDRNGFCLWQKRLEKDHFKWPKTSEGNTINLNESQLNWLLQGVDISQIKPHKTLHYKSVNWLILL